MQSVGISLDEKGRIPVNEQFKTSVEKWVSPMCMYSYKSILSSLLSLLSPPLPSLSPLSLFSPYLPLSFSPSLQYLCNRWLYPWSYVGPQGWGRGTHLCGGNDGGQRSPRLQLCPFSHIHPPCESWCFRNAMYSGDYMLLEWCNNDVIFSLGGWLGWSVGGGTEGRGAWIQSREIPFCCQQ